jgi:hypothetical protein
MQVTYFHPVQNAAGGFVTCFPKDFSKRKSQSDPLPSKIEPKIDPMNHESFHIYTAKIAIRKGDMAKKPRYEVEIQKKYPGMKVEFVEDYSAHIIEVSSDAGASKEKLSSVEAMTAQLHDLVVKISHSS